ncbi:MAG: hypothetical protein AAB799_00325 [Patescibacteria group bacterium]
MKRRIGWLTLFSAIFFSSAFNSDSGQDQLSVQEQLPVIQGVSGAELATINGWFANIYPWQYIPEQTPYQPIPELFTPKQNQTSVQVSFQNQLLNRYGSGADILEYSPHPNSSDHSQWESTYFRNGSRKFFLLYEHIYGTRFRPANGGPKDMNDPYNRKVFMEDIDAMFKKVILPYSYRYVTVEGRAVVYMWSSVQMLGDFGSLLDEARSKYPVFFIGSGEDPGDIERVKYLDGIMEYSLGGYGGGNYVSMMTLYHNHSLSWRASLDSIYQQTGKKILFFATFQAGYDDTKVTPSRGNPPLYPTTREEMVEHARLISLGMKRWKIYDGPGPFVIFSELPEGAAVIPTVARPEMPGRYAGYGTGRIEVVAQFFGAKQ